MARYSRRDFATILPLNHHAKEPNQVAAIPRPRHAFVSPTHRNRTREARDGRTISGTRQPPPSSAPHAHARSAVKTKKLFHRWRPSHARDRSSLCNACRPRVTTVFRSTPSRTHSPGATVQYARVSHSIYNNNSPKHHIARDNSTHNT